MKIGFLGMLTLIFITLKLTGVIAWSWWLVLLPLYGLFVLFFGSIILTGIVWLFLILGLSGMEHLKSKRRNRE